MPFKLCNQVFIQETFSDHPRHDDLHLLYCVQLAEIMLTCKLLYIAIQMFLAHVVVRSMIGTLEHIAQNDSTPFVYAIDPLPNGMIHAFMIHLNHSQISFPRVRHCSGIFC